MPKAIIKLAYRQILDANSEGEFAKNILQYSYEEFKLKSQVYNMEGKFTTFSELKANDGRANSLHYKSGFPIGGFINSLNKKIPILKDALGKDLMFDTYQFEIIESDITDIKVHKVAIVYYTGFYSLHDAYGEYVVLSAGDNRIIEAGLPQETFVLKFQPDLAICNYETI